MTNNQKLWILPVEDIIHYFSLVRFNSLIIVSDKGHVYTCGYGSHGQLGLKSNYN